MLTSLLTSAVIGWIFDAIPVPAHALQAAPARTGVTPAVANARLGAGDAEERPVGKKHSERVRTRSARSREDGDDAPAAAPGVWIGVRMAPIPRALAAHFGEAGLMVSNVAKNSPAEEAGLQQYDIIVSYDGAGVSAGDLPQRIAATGAGNKATLGIIRGGKNLTVTIKPAQRTDEPVEFKYDEPDALVDEAVNMRGGALRLGPGGQWQMQDLGALKDLPLALKGLKLFDPGQGFVFGDDDDGQMFSFDLGGADDDGNVTFEWRVERSDDNGSLSIHRKGDGEFTVERRDKNGDESSATYVNEAELKKGDREAYDFYKSHSMHGGGRILRIRPDLKNLPAIQKDWQEQVEKLLNESMQRSQKTYDEAMQRAQKALQKAQEHQKRIERRVARGEDADSGTSTIIVMQGKDGRLTITTQDDGKSSTHTFASRSELKTKNPKLYERVRDTLDSLGD